MAEGMHRDWSIQEIAKIAGTTSRTLRHYGDTGLLEPSRIGDNGYRYYDASSLVRLQRILLLRELGLGLPAIAQVLEDQRDANRALHSHLVWLESEKSRLSRQISAVETTILKMEGGEELMAQEMFDGFDHAQYKDEVEQRWGAEAFTAGDKWWRSMSADERKEWIQRQKQLAADWISASSRGMAPDSDEAQGLAARQADWLGGVEGVPRNGEGRLTRTYFEGLADLYVADERFAANYGGARGAAFVRDAMRVYAARAL